MQPIEINKHQFFKIELLEVPLYNITMNSETLFSMALGLNTPWQVKDVTFSTDDNIISSVAWKIDINYSNLITKTIQGDKIILRTLVVNYHIIIVMLSFLPYFKITSILSLILQAQC